MNVALGSRPPGLSTQLVRIGLLAVLYVITGQLMFSLDSQPSLVTPQFFIPEALALAMALRFGRPMVLGIFLGQLGLALTAGLSGWPSVGLGLTNGLEALLAIWLTQRFGLDLSFKRHRDYWLFIVMVVFLLQPFSAAMGLLVLGKVPGLGGIAWEVFTFLYGNWWVGNCLAQTQLLPFILWLLPFRGALVERRRQLSWLVWAVPCLFLGLAMSAYWTPIAFDGLRKAMPFFILMPLTAVIALRAVSFGPFCLYTSLCAFLVMYVADARIGNIMMAPEQVGALGLRLLVLCGISQSINLSMIQMVSARDLAQSRAEQLARQLKISLLAASITHEVKQPVAAIQLASQHLLESPGPVSKSLLTAMIQSAEEISASTAKVYSLMRAIPAALKPIDLSTVVRTCLLQEQIKFDQARVQLQLSGLDGPSWIEGEPSQISLALSNLLRNALEVLQSQSGDHRRFVSLELSQSASQVELTIGDNGPGFPTENWKPELFQTSKASGSGLGLYLVQLMADNHNAQVRFGRSSMGGGEVSLRFPIA